MEKNKGITLIALVITIIILLILAGVTLNLTLGEKGIFTTAQKAAQNYTDAEYNEQLALSNFINEINRQTNGTNEEENLVEYTVSFDGNGQTSGNMDLQELISGIPQKLNKNQFKKEGYAFMGWATSSTGPKMYSDEQSINISENITLYAVWEEIEITIVNAPSNHIIAGNTHKLNVEITPQEAEINLTWNSSDDSVATVDSNGQVNGVSCGRATITVSNGVKSNSVEILVDEYLQLNENINPKTGSFEIYRTGTSTSTDGLYSLENLYLTVSHSENTAAWVSKNEIDLTKIKTLEFSGVYRSNLEGLGMLYRVGITNKQHASDSDWLVSQGESMVSKGWENIETYTWELDVSNYDSAYLKTWIQHGEEANDFTVYMNNYYILAKPK